MNLPFWQYAIAEEISKDNWVENEDYRFTKYSEAEKILLKLRKLNPEKKLDILQIKINRMNA